MFDLASPIKFLKGVGPRRAKQFQALGIETIEGLLYHFPRRYEDRTHFVPLSQVQENSTATVRGKIKKIKSLSSWKRRNFQILRATIEDETQAMDVVWFNQPFLSKILKEDQELILYGEVDRYDNKLQFNNPEFEIIEAEEEAKDTLNVGRIVPLYPTSGYLTQRSLRKFIKGALDKYISTLQDFIPYDIRSRQKLPNLAKALINIHFPREQALLDEAYQRLGFDECFLYQIPIMMRKARRNQKKALALTASGKLLNKVLEHLNFKLTNSQLEVLEQIKKDLARPIPMQRLLEGDVGSGKTIVALLAALVAIESGVQVALMVPTEIIAKQHLRTIKRLTSAIKDDFRVELLSSSLEESKRRTVYSQVKKGRVNLLVGTHALLAPDLKFKNLGLIIIDEQHKFGVEQRAQLSRKAHPAESGLLAHCLIMTATPIPRTLAMTIYGDLDISVLKELPPGRKPVETLVFSQDEVAKAYEFLRQIVAAGKQAYIVYPIIEESQSLDLKSAQTMFKELKESYFKDFKIALIHGRQKAQVQDKVMQDFYQGKIDILVATSILEVGVDVPNAACMLIEEADRFGLSTLHQLRGRVGRSSEQAHCLMVSSPSSEEARARIKAMRTLCDGFKIAEADLRIRGPGQFFGTQQHGLGDLMIIDPLRQMHIIKNTREEALRLVNEDPSLGLEEHSLLRARLQRRYPNFETLMMIG